MGATGTPTSWLQEADPARRQAVEAQRERILRGELPPVAESLLSRAVEVVKRHDAPERDITVDGHSVGSADLVLATAALPRALRAQCERHWQRNQETSCRRQARQALRARGAARSPTDRSHWAMFAAHLQRRARAHAAAATSPRPMVLSPPRAARARGAGRPAARRSTRSSARSGDSGSDGPPGEPPPPPRLAVAPPPRAIYQFGCSTREQRGEVVA